MDNAGALAWNPSENNNQSQGFGLNFDIEDPSRMADEILNAKILNDKFKSSVESKERKALELIASINQELIKNK